MVVSRAAVSITGICLHIVGIIISVCYLYPPHEPPINAAGPLIGLPQVSKVRTKPASILRPGEGLEHFLQEEGEVLRRCTRQGITE